MSSTFDHSKRDNFSGLQWLHIHTENQFVLYNVVRGLLYKAGVNILVGMAVGKPAFDRIFIAYNTDI